MRNYFADGWSVFKRALFSDYINLYLFSATIILFMADYLIWKFGLGNRDIYITVLNGLYPVKYLAVILILNTPLAIFSYDKEKEMSYLLFSANIFIALLVLVLELFYLFNLSSYG